MVHVEHLMRVREKERWRREVARPVKAAKTRHFPPCKSPETFITSWLTLRSKPVVVQEHFYKRKRELSQPQVE